MKLINLKSSQGLLSKLLRAPINFNLFIFLTFYLIDGQRFIYSDERNNWHQWRGPEANGVSRSATPPLKWNEKKNISWKVQIPGKGSSTPIIWNNKVFILTSVNTEKIDPSLPRPEDQPERVFGIKHPNTSYKFLVICYDRFSGEKMWQRIANELIPHEGHHRDNNFASASPTTDGKRLYCWFGSAGLYCYDLDGTKLWEQSLGKIKMGASLGEGCSPVIHKDKLIVVRDHQGSSSIHVLEARTGKSIWQKERDEPNGWATPLIVNHSGKTQVITSGSNFVRSYNLKDGKIIWQCAGLTNNAIPSPVADKEKVFRMTGYKGYSLLAVKLSASGNASKSDSILWTKSRGTPYVPSPLLYDGMLYFSQSNQNLFSCLQSEDGKSYINRERLPGLTGIYASPIGANDRVYVTDRIGTTIVINKSKELEVLSTNKLNEPLVSSLSVAGNQIFFRGSKHLYCIAEEIKSAKAPDERH